MGIKLSINSAMEEEPHFFIFLKSHQIREAHMVPENNGEQPSNPQAIMLAATSLVSKLIVTLKVIQLLAWRPHMRYETLC